MRNPQTPIDTVVEINGRDGVVTLRKGSVYHIAAECDTPGPDIEYVDTDAFWTGEIDSWGKYTFKPVDGQSPFYLFPREIKYAEPYDE